MHGGLATPSRLSFCTGYMLYTCYTPALVQDATSLMNPQGKTACPELVKELLREALTEFSTDSHTCLLPLHLCYGPDVAVTDMLRS